MSSSRPGMLVIREIGSDRKGVADWLAVPKRVHADDPFYVIQPDKQERHRISREHNPYLLLADAAFFVCYRDGLPVGRISAQHDPRLKAANGDVIGQFGFSDFIEDQEVADALVDAARAWLRARGVTQMRGPFNLSINQECGCLIEGFDTQQAIMMPRSRPWTGPMLERSGLAKEVDLSAYRVAPKRVPEEFLRRARQVGDEQAVRVRPLDTKRLHQEFELLGEIFNDGWQKNWGFLPFERAELAKLAAELKPIMRPGYGFFIEVGGEPVGVMVALPNINEIIAPFKGKFGIVNNVRLVSKLLLERAETARVLVLGVKRSFQGGPFGAALVVRMLEALIERGKKYKLDWIEFSWVLETNKPALAVLGAASAYESSKYRIYNAKIT